MKIIDAHIHFANQDYFSQTALLAGHENTVSHLENVMGKNNIIFAIAMGADSDDDNLSAEAIGIDLAGKLDLATYNQPQWVSYCCAIQSEAVTKERMQASLDSVERHLKTRQCVGIKFYTGYNHVYLADKRHAPFFELAQYYDVPVVVHTGDTANAEALLKYSHPLTVDEAAVKFPRVRFVMAHYGNPWIVDATQVVKKNPNVFIDLSGLAQGNFEVSGFLKNYEGYIQHLRTWMAYLGSYEKIMYGSDWPLVNLDSYIALIQAIVPEKYHEGVFFENVQQVFPKIVPLLCHLL